MQIEYLAARAGMDAVAGLRIVRHMGHYGNALLTRHRVLGVRRHDPERVVLVSSRAAPSTRS
jgi:hypothetical protein